MRDEGVIYVAGHPLLNRRCTRLPGCIRLRNDLYCVDWGVKLYSLTHSRPATEALQQQGLVCGTVCHRIYATKNSVFGASGTCWKLTGLLL